MKHPAFLLMASLVLALLPDRLQAEPGFLEGLEKNQCFVCHQDLDEDFWPEDDLAADLHLAKGIVCEDCHGGDASAEDMDESMDPEKGFIGVPEVQEIPEFCGRCHSDPAYMARYNPALPVDQVQKYYTSRHGQRLEAGDSKVAQCVSCHGAHGMIPGNNTTSPVYEVNIALTCARCHADPKYMEGYDIPTDQYEKYARSVHGVALLERHDTASPACNDCHGNHGAVPPGVPSVANICSVCHARTSELFAASPHKPAFDTNNWPECSQCHANHDVRKPDDSMLGVTAPSICLSCHRASDDRGYQTAAAMKQAITSLVDQMGTAEAGFEDTRNRGMEVGEIELLLREVRSHLIQSRALVHTVDTERVRGETMQGKEIALRAVKLAEAAISEYHFRRKGLGIATLIITFVAVMLYLKIRQIESRQR